MEPLDFKNGNYFKEMDVSLALKTLNGRSPPCWLLRPSSQENLKTISFRVSQSVMHVRVGEAISFEEARDKYKLWNEYYLGPQELLFEEQRYDKLFQQALSADPCFFPFMAKALRKAIKINCQLIFNHCKEHPKDCGLFYRNLEAITLKLGTLASQDNNLTMEAAKASKLCQQINIMAQAFRKLEQQVTIGGMTRDQALLPQGFMFHTAFKDPVEQIPLFMLSDLSHNSLTHVKMLFSENNQEEIFPLIAKAVNHFEHALEHAAMTIEDIKKILPDLTYFEAQVQSGHMDASGNTEIHALIKECPNLTKVKTYYIGPLFQIQNKEKITDLKIVIPSSFLGEFNVASALALFPNLTHLSLEKTYFGTCDANKHLKGLRSNSLESITFKLKDVNLNELLTVENIAEIITNLPSLKEIKFPSSFLPSEELQKLLALHRIAS